MFVDIISVTDLRLNVMTLPDSAIISYWRITGLYWQVYQLQLFPEAIHVCIKPFYLLTNWLTD